MELASYHNVITANCKSTHIAPILRSLQKGKDNPYSITERRVQELIQVLGSQPAGDVSHKPGVGCHYFPPGFQLPSRPSRGLLPILRYDTIRDAILT